MCAVVPEQAASCGGNNWKHNLHDCNEGKQEQFEISFFLLFGKFIEMQ
jgi:hypothetical protein